MSAGLAAHSALRTSQPTPRLITTAALEPASEMAQEAAAAPAALVWPVSETSSSLPSTGLVSGPHGQENREHPIDHMKLFARIHQEVIVTDC